jgi:hypothetical protein
MRKFLTILIAAALLCAGFTRGALAQEGAEPAPSIQYTLSSEQAKRIIAARARAVMLAIKSRDMERLATFVHPRKGVRFSPYVYVMPNERVLNRRQIVNLYRSRKRLVWGEADGSGEPIRMTFRQYLNNFVYRQDLLTDKQVGYNPPDRRGPGTSVNNLLETYPRSILVRYSHEGIKAPQGGEPDWQQLWLVFEKLGNQWYLVGIANNEWTI